VNRSIVGGTKSERAEGLMGVLSDLVVARAEDAERIGRAVAPASEFGGIDIKGIDSVKFGTLHSILTGRSFEVLLAEYQPVVSVSDEGPWVFRIPSDLVTRLAAVSGEEERAAVSRWAATDEFVLDRWPVGEVAQAFDAIASLARKAESTGDALFLWMSL
jgi:hypothetical protein